MRGFQGAHGPTEGARSAMRFFFDLVSRHETLRDDTGSEARSLDDAMAQARSVIEEMAEAGELSDIAEDWRLVIRDTTGAVRASLPVEEAVPDLQSFRRANG
ncbi:DUF6894 family protein [Methylobacterium sp. A54F]